MSVELISKRYINPRTFQHIDLSPSVHTFPPCSARNAARRSEGVSRPRNNVSHLFLDK
jgi:hypothetical protein